VVINPQGEVFVSASAIHAVLKLAENKLEIWAQDEEKLTWANGLQFRGDHLLAGGAMLVGINMKPKEPSHVEMNPSVNDFEGIASDGREGYFFTTVEPGGLYHLDKHNRVTVLDTGEAYFGDLDFDLSNKKIYIPRGDQDGEFFLSVFSVN
jgi:hypothetical protein